MTPELIAGFATVGATALLAFIGYLAANACSNIQRIAISASKKGDDLEKQLMAHQMDCLKVQLDNTNTFVKKGELTAILADLFKKIDNMDTKIDRRLDAMDGKLDSKQDKGPHGTV
jgi:hypothetical protein